MNKRVSLKIIRHLSNQIQAIDDEHSLKNSFLYDYGNLSRDCLCQIVKCLLDEHVISRNIKVLTLADDIFIVNVQKVVRPVKRNFYVVNVSGNLKAPALMESIDNIQNMLSSISKQLQSEAHEIVPEEDWCLTTAFGYLINYPVLYFQTKEPDFNCLGSVDLKIFQILLDDELVLSFSVPLELLNKHKFIENHIESYLKTYTDINGRYQIKKFIANHAHVAL